jgi:hypothetical protein
MQHQSQMLNSNDATMDIRGEALGFLDNKNYELIIRQHPQRARMCGFGERDRRPIDPPPIIQLKITSGSNTWEEQPSPFYVIHAGLWSPDMEAEQNILYTLNAPIRILTGSLVSSGHFLKDINDELTTFFVFPDLSVRIDGKYRLKFMLMDISEPVSRVKATVFSDIFTVYQAKKFPGMIESTELSRCLSEQGLKIPIRKDHRPRKYPGSHHDPEETHSCESDMD